LLISELKDVCCVNFLILLFSSGDQKRCEVKIKETKSILQFSKNYVLSLQFLKDVIQRGVFAQFGSGNDRSKRILAVFKLYIFSRLVHGHGIPMESHGERPMGWDSTHLYFP